LGLVQIPTEVVLLNLPNSLKKSLAVHAWQYAVESGLERHAYLSDGGTLLLSEYDDYGEKRHANFLHASYEEIRKNPTWLARLETPHPRTETFESGCHPNPKELDSVNSSDALLMNIFCYPGTTERESLLDLLGVTDAGSPHFGWPGKVPLHTGEDATKIDVLLGDTYFEAKLTEKDFTSATEDKWGDYRDLPLVFDIQPLLDDNQVLSGYQLVRNILAAHAHGKRFVLLVDERRPDLLRAYWRVMTCVKLPEVRARCGFVIWQEIAKVSHIELLAYLSRKYGIE